MSDPGFVISVLVVAGAIGRVAYRDIRNTPEWERTITVTPPDDVRTLTAPIDPHRRAIAGRPWYTTGGKPR